MHQIVTLLAVVATFLLVIPEPCLSTSGGKTLLRFKRGSLTDDAERILRQGSSVDVNNVGQLVDLVERNRAEECLSRVICELSNNARAHGDNGARFAQSLLKFRQSKHPKVKQYLDAMTNGVKAKNIEQCRSHYPRCNHPTNEVVSVGNRLLRTR